MAIFLLYYGCEARISIAFELPGTLQEQGTDGTFL
jgi:hypothetical protein